MQALDAASPAAELQTWLAECRAVAEHEDTAQQPVEPSRSAPGSLFEGQLSRVGFPRLPDLPRPCRELCTVQDTPAAAATPLEELLQRALTGGQAELDAEAFGDTGDSRPELCKARASMQA